MDSKRTFADVVRSKTSDGSETLYSSVFKAHYHSSHGAKQESNHVFIQEGLNYYSSIYPEKEITILEIGMGTGLNVLLSLIQNRRPRIHYTALEAYPVKPETCRQLNYANDSKEQAYFDLIHNSPWEEITDLSHNFSFIKHQVLFEKFDYSDQYNIIYFDAFAPSCQPHLWTSTLLAPIANAIKSGGILVTFCAQGAFKRELKSLGLEVERVPGPPGKREMTRATKK